MTGFIESLIVNQVNCSHFDTSAGRYGSDGGYEGRYA